MTQAGGLAAARWTGRRVLVTGAGGFIGSHLVERLVAEGARVRGYVHYNSRGHRGWLESLPPEMKSSVEVVDGELSDLAHVRGAVGDCQVVMHLGAQVGIPKSYQEPGLFIASNIVGTFNVLTACREHDVERVVHMSSSEVYGSARYVPMDEGHPLQAQSPYAATKIAADKLVESYHLSFGLPSVTVRAFNTFGPRQSARAVVPTIISQALWRDRVVLGALKPRRDLNFVQNTVDALLAAASVPGVEGEVFNAGSGRSISVGELAQLSLQVLGVDKPVVTEGNRERPEASQVKYPEADCRKAAEHLGWLPAVSLDEGIQRMADWVRAHPESFKVEEYAI
jgi:dTDP-glucose 4,6-dehydratase